MRISGRNERVCKLMIGIYNNIINNEREEVWRGRGRVRVSEREKQTFKERWKHVPPDKRNRQTAWCSTAISYLRPVTQRRPRVPPSLSLTMLVRCYYTTASLLTGGAKGSHSVSTDVYLIRTWPFYLFIYFFLYIIPT